MVRLLLGTLLLSIILGQQAGAPLVYPAYNDVTAHPDAARYSTARVSFDSFGNRTRWATRGQFCDVAEYTSLLDMFFASGMMAANDLTAIHWSMLGCPLETFKAAMSVPQKRGVRVSGIWGAFPGAGPQDGVDGAPYRERFGPQLDALDEVFGPANWMGVNLGEADGHYEGGYAGQMVHGSTDRREYFGNFEDEFEFEQLQLGSKLTSLMSDAVGSHYWARSGLLTVIGAETAQGLPSSQMMYSFLRGAAKQYGTLLVGNPSTCGRFGEKCCEPAFLSTPTCKICKHCGCMMYLIGRQPLLQTTVPAVPRAASRPTPRSAMAAPTSCSRTSAALAAGPPSRCCGAWPTPT